MRQLDSGIEAESTNGTAASSAQLKGFVVEGRERRRDRVAGDGDRRGRHLARREHVARDDRDLQDAVAHAVRDVEEARGRDAVAGLRADGDRLDRQQPAFAHGEGPDAPAVAFLAQPADEAFAEVGGVAAHEDVSVGGHRHGVREAGRQRRGR